QFVADNGNSHKTGANTNKSQQTGTSSDGDIAKNGQPATNNNKQADNGAVVKNNKSQQSATKPADANRNNAERTDKMTPGSAANNGNTTAQTTPNKPGNNAGQNGGKQGADNSNKLADNNKPSQQYDQKEVPIRKIESVGRDGENDMDT